MINNKDVISFVFEDNYDWLSRSELQILACFMTSNVLSRGDISDLSKQNMGKSMTTSLIYKNFARLYANGFIENEGKNKNENEYRASEKYRLTEKGKSVFLATVKGLMVQT